MVDILVSRKDDGSYVATQGRKVVATGSTQGQAADKAHSNKPDDPVLGQRERNTEYGKRDQWRRIH